MTARRIRLALALISQLLLSWGTVWAQTPVPVPSGVPTEAPGTPIKVGVPDTTLTVSGCSSPNAFVQLFDNNTSVGTAIAGNSGQFSKKIVIDNDSAGLHNIRIYYDDVNGRTSSIITQNISLSSQSNTALNLLLPTTIEHEPEPVALGSFLIFRGTTCPQSLVNVVINNNFTLAAQADQRGNWYVIADTENYYVGSHTYDALSSKNGQLSPKTQKYLFTTVGDGSGPLPRRPELTIPQIIEPVDQFSTNSRAVTVRGTGPINTQIELYVDDQLEGSVFTNAFGEWSFIFTMQRQLQTIRAKSCFNQNCSELSPGVQIRYIGPLAFCDDTNTGQTANANRLVLAETDEVVIQSCVCSLNFNLAQYRFFGIRKGAGLDLELHNIIGAVNFDALIDWGDATIEHLTLVSHDALKLHHIYKQSGQYNGSITFTDAQGCLQTQYFSAEVGQGALNLWALLIIPTGGAVVYGLYRGPYDGKLRLSSRLKLRWPGGLPRPRLAQAEEPKPVVAKPKPVKKRGSKGGWYQE
ncbi:MAG TPA: Ig-like domain-containing protein [Candidatus Saccharimonadales bacterium]